MIDYAALKAILPCLNHVRTVRLNGARLEAEAVNRLADIAVEVRKQSLQVNYTYFYIFLKSLRRLYDAKTKVTDR